MKLELADFLKMVCSADYGPLDAILPALLKMTEGYDSISYDKKMDYREIYDALKWLCEMKDYGREFNVDRKTFTAIGKSFEGDRQQEILRWLIKLTRKR